MENRINSLTRILFVVTLMALIAMGVAIRSCNEKSKDYTNLISSINAINDTLEVTKNSDSSLTGKIDVILADQGVFKKIQTQDSTIKALQKLINKNTTSATIINSGTNINTKTASTVKPKDTVYKDNLIYIYPEYSSTINLGKWINGYSLSNKDTTILDLRITNEYKIVVKKEKKKSVIEVTSMNPYSTLETVRSYQELPKDIKRLGIGLHAGYGASLQNNEIKLAPTISIGINYNLINIK